MSEINPEQELCKRCGFCCDGTLFRYAVVNDDDVLLPGMEDSEEDGPILQAALSTFQWIVYGVSATRFGLQKLSV